jgi:putative endonuclease
MKNNTKLIGNEGEAVAKKFLIEQGYRILETNWRLKKLELDIIAIINKTLVIVEVKTRKSNAFGEPELFVTKQKQNFLIAAANGYVLKNNIQLETRFDIVAIIQNNNSQTVKHLESAFSPQIK